jgi:hypothetical protein
MKLQLAAICGTFVLAACASGEPEPLLISSVTVNTDLSAVQSREAVEYWQNLSSDLETAIATEFAGSIDTSGHPITVDIDELSLSETFAPGATIDNATLSGLVTLQDTVPDARPDPAYTITATAQDATSYLPADNVVEVNPTTPQYYEAIVKAFASGAADVLRQGS